MHLQLWYESLTGPNIAENVWDALYGGTCSFSTYALLTPFSSKGRDE